MTKITYYGHSCFIVSAENGYTVCFDPYENDSVPGLRLPQPMLADKVICSHEHKDHNASHLITIRKDGPENPWKISALSVPHDHHEGAHRGMNAITILQNDDEKIIHFGDLGRELKKGEAELLKNAGVIMIPCAGYYTIDAIEARRTIELLKPQLTILMHYRFADTGYDVQMSRTEVEKCIPAENLMGNAVEYGERQGIITLKPLQ